MWDAELRSGYSCSACFLIAPRNKLAPLAFVERFFHFLSHFLLFLCAIFFGPSPFSVLESYLILPSSLRAVQVFETKQRKKKNEKVILPWQFIFKLLFYLFFWFTNRRTAYTHLWFPPYFSFSGAVSPFPLFSCFFLRISFLSIWYPVFPLADHASSALVSRAIDPPKRIVFLFFDCKVAPCEDGR